MPARPIGWAPKGEEGELQSKETVGAVLAASTLASGSDGLKTFASFERREDEDEVICALILPEVKEGFTSMDATAGGDVDGTDLLPPAEGGYVRSPGRPVSAIEDFLVARGSNKPRRALISCGAP